MIVYNIYDRPLGSNVGTVQLPSLHSHFYLGRNACIHMNDGPLHHLITVTLNSMT